MADLWSKELVDLPPAGGARGGERVGGTGDAGPADRADDIALITYAPLTGIADRLPGRIELCFAWRGRVVMRIDGEDHYMAEGSLCLMDEAVARSLTSADADAVAVSVYLGRTLFAEGVFRAFLESDNAVAAFLRGEAACGHLFMTDIGGQVLGHTMRALMREYRIAGYRADFIVQARTLMLLARAASLGAYSYLGMDERMMRVLDLIERDPAQATCSSLARAMGLSETYLSQCVKRRMGRSLSHIVRDVRLEQGLVLLSTTDLPVDAVAHRVGYASYSHFHRIFAERYGVTPAQARTFSQTG